MPGTITVIICILYAWAIIDVIQSGSSRWHKALWILSILVLPVIGIGAWIVVGRRKAVSI